MALNSPSKPNRLSRRFAPANENGLSSYMAGALSPGGAVPQNAQLQFGGASSQPKISSAPAQTNTPAPTYTNDISTNTPVSTSGGGGGLKSYMDKMAALGSKAVPSAIEAAARQFNEENAYAKDAQGNFVLTPPDKEGNRYEVESPEAIRERLSSYRGSAADRAEYAEKVAKRIEELQGDVDRYNRQFSEGEDPVELADASERAERLRVQIAELNAMRKAIIAGKGEDNLDQINSVYRDARYRLF